MTASGRGGRFRGAPAALRPRGNPLIRLQIPAPAQRLDTSRSAPMRPAGPSDLAAPRQPDAGERSAAPVSGIGTHRPDDAELKSRTRRVDNRLAGRPAHPLGIGLHLRQPKRATKRSGAEG
jgi:hypothetical protein